jgi:hypothetical protein
VNDNGVWDWKWWQYQSTLNATSSDLNAYGISTINSLSQQSNEDFLTTLYKTPISFETFYKHEEYEQRTVVQQLRFDYSVVEGDKYYGSAQLTTINGIDVATYFAPKEKIILLSLDDFSITGFDDSWLQPDSNGTTEIIEHQGENVIKMNIDDDTATDSPVTITKIIDTNDGLFNIDFDFMFQTPTGHLEVLINDILIGKVY